MRSPTAPTSRGAGAWLLLAGGLVCALAAVVGLWWSARPDAPERSADASAESVEPSVVDVASPHSTVRGTVTDTDKNPLPGVVVRLVGDGGRGPNGTVAGPEWETTTDADGSYVFGQVPRGVALRVLFAPRGKTWATTWHDRAWNPYDHRPIASTEDGEVRVDVSLQPAASIAGRVRGFTGSHTVLLERRVDGQWTEIDRTARRSGSRDYLFTGLSKGVHRVSVHSVKSGLAYAPAAVRAAEAAITRVDTGRAVRGVDVTVSPPVIMTGRLVTSTGVPLAGREVMFHRGWASSGPRGPVLEVDPRTVRTDSAGRFRVELGTGRWNASVGLRCVMPGADPWVEVRAGQPAMARDVVHDGVGSVTGRVTRPDGRPRGAVQVTFHRAGDPCGTSVRTDRGGRFRGDDLPPGTYDVEYVWNTPRGQFRKERTLTLALFERRVGVETVLR